MINGIIKWSLHNRLLVVLCAFLLLGWGIFESQRMSVDVFPDLTAPTVTVLTEAHGMAPGEVESLITFPIETTLNGASGVRRVRSATAVGISVVWVEFDWGTDIFQARQIVSEKLQLAQGTLPPGIDSPVLAPISSIMGEIMFIALVDPASEADTQQLKTLADWTVRRRLLAVPGVSQVIPIGGDTKQFQVLVQPEKLASYGIGLNEVTHALEQANENSSAGFFNQGGQEFLIQGLGRARDIHDLSETVVSLVEDHPVQVKDVALVQVGPALKRGEGSLNGKPAVILGIQKQPATNTIQLTQDLDQVIQDIQTSLPSNIRIETDIFRQADFIEVSIANVLEALRDGAILVILIVLLFLGNWRATGITVLAIPLSLVVAIIFLKWMGGTLNTMTLGGMAIAIGALVDDAIIDVENVVRRLRENALKPHPQSWFHVVYEASKEVRVSIVFATFIIVLVFLPLFFLTGVEGRLLRPLGIAYIIALGASLVTALTITPVLCSFFLTQNSVLEKEKESRLVGWLKRVYQPVLTMSIRRWQAVSAAAGLLLLLAVASIPFMGRSFLPDFNEGTLTISAVTLPGTSLQESDKMGRMVEEILLRQPEVVSTARRTGRAELDEHAQDVNASEIDVNLKMGDRSKSAFLDQIRNDLTLVPGMNITVGQPISHRIDHMLSGTRANIAVKIFGPDLTQLRDLAKQVQSQMQQVPGVVDLSTEQQIEIPFLAVRFNRNAMARYGLTIKDLAEYIETAFSGQKVSSILDKQAAFDLIVRMDPSVLSDLEGIRQTLITTKTGAQVPLHVLAEVHKDLGPNMIIRENVQRKIVVMCNVSRDVGTVVKEIQDRVKQSITLPDGYHVAYGGQFESATEATKILFGLGIAVILGIFLLLFMALKTGRDAFLVMVNLPLALIGGIVGVFLQGGTLSIASIIGFITLFGIATRNGILLISHFQYLMEAEHVKDRMTAVIRGAQERLAPILMTALSAGLALIPLALKGDQPGGEIEAPMAIVILCGLLTSTLLNALVVPALYFRFGSRP
ncbi:MAG: efflux RND transporter permease subunit [Acidobacteria bacterium]|nr:efflux RND transporter permease subunit [Acidobacteriota bacterium]MCB9396306.1 efflux RND transporter permease subunit [Acidobacteriota bacterium]